MGLTFSTYYTGMPTTTSSAISYRNHLYFGTPFLLNMNDFNTRTGRESGTQISFGDIIAANSARRAVQRSIQRNTELLLYWDINFGGGTIGAASGNALTYVNYSSPAHVATVNKITSLKVAPYTRVTLYDGGGAGEGPSIVYDGYNSSETFNRALKDTDYYEVAWVGDSWNDVIDSFKIEAYPMEY